MVTTTPRELIAGALKLIGVLAAGEAPDATTERDCFDRFNAWIDALGIERQSILAINTHDFSVTANDGTYTVGTGADFNMVRPIYVTGCAYLLPSSSPSLEIPLAPITDQAWESTYIKGLTAPYPTQFYYNRTAPTATITFWPVPTQNLTVRLYTADAWTQSATPTTSVALPDGWERMLRTNLAMELAPEFGRALDPLVAKMAMDALSAVKRANFALSDLSLDPAIVAQPPRYNIFSDT